MEDMLGYCMFINGAACILSEVIYRLVSRGSGRKYVSETASSPMRLTFKPLILELRAKK
jgi:hypothetical protein